MTDNEIIKALEWCHTAANHIGSATLSKEQISAVFDLINRQNAEIERLKKDSDRLKKVQMQLDDMCIMYNIIKAEAIKEFAERVKMAFYYKFEELIPSIMDDKIDNLVKEMVGGDK